MTYLMVLPVSFYRVGENEFASESAFAEHLKMLLNNMPKSFSSIHLLGTVMSEAEYLKNKEHLTIINEVSDRIYFTDLCPAHLKAKIFWSQYAIKMFRIIWRLVKTADIVHSNPSMNLFQPLESFALLAGLIQGKKTLSVIDIDIRQDLHRAYRLGMISRKRYIVERLFLEPIRRFKLNFFARFCSLSLYKGNALVADYGKGRNSVKNFFDVSHSSKHVISELRLSEKIQHNQNSSAPMACVYFGRLIPRKGVDYCIRSVVEAKTSLNANIHFTIIGQGDEKEKLKALIKELNAEHYIFIEPAVPFDSAFFEKLYQFDVLLAAPLTEDTPRSAFDAMASGMAICAYDTDYFLTLSQFGPMVMVSPWLDTIALAKSITGMATDRQALAAAQSSARAFALENTQEAWLTKRLAWTNEFCMDAMP